MGFIWVEKSEEENWVSIVLLSNWPIYTYCLSLLLHRYSICEKSKDAPVFTLFAWKLRWHSSGTVSKLHHWFHCVKPKIHFSIRIDTSEFFPFYLKRCTIFQHDFSLIGWYLCCVNFFRILNFTKKLFHLKNRTTNNLLLLSVCAYS